MIEPLKDRIVVKRDSPKQHAGLIEYTEDEKPNTGTVLSIGSDVRDVQVGDRVMFRKNDGAHIRYQGEELLVLTEKLIWGVVTECGD